MAKRDAARCGHGSANPRMVGLLCTGPVRLQCSKCVVCFGHTDRPSCAKIQAVYRLPRTDRVRSVEAIQEMNQGLRTLSVNSHARGFQDNAMELVIEKDLQFHSCGRQNMDKVRQWAEIGDKLVNCHDEPEPQTDEDHCPFCHNVVGVHDHDDASHGSTCPQTGLKIPSSGSAIPWAILSACCA